MEKCQIKTLFVRQKGFDIMASIRKKNNSYEIRVSWGYEVNGKQKIQQMTWKPETGMTEKQIEKEVNRQAVCKVEWRGNEQSMNK